MTAASCPQTRVAPFRDVTSKQGGTPPVILSDGGIDIPARHRGGLAEKFTLDESNPDAQRCMLNKLCTYRVAVAAGVPTPRFWTATTRDQVLALRDELVYPLLVKPLFSHLYE